MSFRSGFNTDLVLNNLKVNGKLSLVNELDISSIEVTTLTVTGDSELQELTVLGDLIVDGATALMSLDVAGQTDLDTVYVSGIASLNELTVSNNTILNTVNANGNIVANSETVTPAQLGYVSGATSNLQTQINAKANITNPTFNGTVTLPATQNLGYMYFNNTGTSQVMDYKTEYFGAIGTNATGGDAEMDFFNVGFNASDLALSAFDWYLLTSETTKTLLARMYNSGNMMIKGLLTASGISTTTLTASGQSQLANVTSNNLTVNGNLNVTGQITGNMQTNMEVVQVNVTGNQTQAGGTLPLAYNTTGTTNYVVIPSIYYGYHGSSGTYDVADSSGALQNVIINTRTSSGFSWVVQKSTGDNVNVWITFLVLYNVPGTNYPASY